ncbi:MAG TPA: glycosyl transferase [Thermodesulfobacteriota bacterium]|nr:glycosyl transferase [Thermodesulfobacteriota bacterium]
MYYFCTYFDHRYLPKGLALFKSLKQHCSAFRLWVLCMDSMCYEALSQLDFREICLISFEDFERGDEELLRAKRNRTLIEYYFTCTPSLPLYIFNNYPQVDLITYLDADLFFFADPAPIYDEVADHPIAIIEHRFPPNLRYLEQFGIYNVGWLSFRRDEHAFACLRWWRERCLEWCYDRCEDGRFADQKYLDEWPSRFQSAVVLSHKGANLAPWNLGNYCIHQDGNGVWVDEDPLIFFHFHGFKQIVGWVYDPNLAFYKVKLSEGVRRNIVVPYVRALLEMRQQVSPLLEKVSLQGNMRAEVQSPPHVALLSGLLRICKGFLAREYIVVMNR